MTWKRRKIRLYTLVDLRLGDSLIFQCPGALGSMAGLKNDMAAKSVKLEDALELVREKDGVIQVNASSCTAN